MTMVAEQPRIYVASLADYNAGMLHGRWIDATQDVDEIKEQIAAMLRRSHEPNVMVECPECEGDADEDNPCSVCGTRGEVPSAEEFAIHDYEGFEGVRLSEFGDLEHVAALAKYIDEYGPAFAAWYEMGAPSNEPDDWDDEFTDAFAGEWNTVEEFAEDLLEETGQLESIPENLRAYFDFESFARDLRLGGDIYVDRDRAPAGRVFVFWNR